MKYRSSSRPQGPALSPNPPHSPTRTPTCKTPIHKRVPQQPAPPFSPQDRPDNTNRHTCGPGGLGALPPAPLTCLPPDVISSGTVPWPDQAQS